MQKVTVPATSRITAISSWTNQRSVFRSRDQSRPIRGQYYLPLEGEVGRVEEGNGAAQTLHELEDGESGGGLILEGAAQQRRDLDQSEVSIQVT